MLMQGTHTSPIQSLYSYEWERERDSGLFSTSSVVPVVSMTAGDAVCSSVMTTGELVVHVLLELPAWCGVFRGTWLISQHDQRVMSKFSHHQTAWPKTWYWIIKQSLIPTNAAIGHLWLALSSLAETSCHWLALIDSFFRTQDFELGRDYNKRVSDSQPEVDLQMKLKWWKTMPNDTSAEDPTILLMLYMKLMLPGDFAWMSASYSMLLHCPLGEKGETHMCFPPPFEWNQQTSHLQTALHRQLLVWGVGEIERTHPK